ncbi:hypothetical protein PUNSTDRAFT_141757 [Punctularia strigosozonata HHB-11173 SS5]|uniref:uncharacterized protein n=1 Tax=Punctularia strigosozonata (strain HHB-11173) TaxID=741275 RepID=UPI0004417D73|nr:uncharacterized protein PUNSTDRAFT_141757 [Punctularia strigosozonata HHB-11173 SS5]EIN11375.1 hypothetical protein PUNSTDRAFT_141757 [Punctularia strigosozonata HHB-11173 SS5]
MTGGNTKSLLSLPDELLREVLVHLPAGRDVCRVASCCRRLTSIVEENVDLRYALALGKSGMVGNAIAVESAQDCLKKLLFHETALSTICWKSSNALPFDDEESPFEGTHHRFAGGVFATYNDGVFRTEHLPTTTAPEMVVNEMVIDFLDGPVNALAFDPSQDLVVFIQGNGNRVPVAAHLRALTTQVVHPKAHTPLLKISTSSARTQEVEAYIHGDLIALTWLSLHMMRLFVWDWKSGACLVQNKSLAYTCGFSFLSDGMFLAVSPEQNGEIQLYSFRDADGGLYEDPRRLAVLHLPRLQAKASIISMSVQPSTSQADLGKRRPFRPDLESGIILFRISYYGARHPDGEECVVCVRRSTFVRRLAQALKEDWTECRVVAWDDWGPREAHLRFCDIAVSGERVIIKDQRSDDTDMQGVVILDFNVHRIPAVISDPTLDSDGLEFMDCLSSYKTERGDVFKQDVVTEIPHRMFAKAPNEGFDAALEWMIYEDGFIGCDFEEDCGLRILSF